jgi:hypothetical protein
VIRRTRTSGAAELPAAVRRALDLLRRHKHSLGGAGACATVAWATVVTGEGIGSLIGGLVGLRLQPRYPSRVVTPMFALSA